MDTIDFGLCLVCALAGSLLTIIFYDTRDAIRERNSAFERIAAIFYPWNRRAAPASSAPPAEADKDDQLIKERDAAEEWADKLAYAIGEYFGVDVGEHSNQNLPWSEAFEAIPDEPAKAAPIIDVLNTAIDHLRSHPNWGPAKEEPVAWGVQSNDGWEFIAPWPSSCHEHINDSISEDDIEAATWKVVPLYAVPPDQSARIAELEALVSEFCVLWQNSLSPIYQAAMMDPSWSDWDKEQLKKIEDFGVRAGVLIGDVAATQVQQSCFARIATLEAALRELFESLDGKLPHVMPDYYSLGIEYRFAVDRLLAAKDDARRVLRGEALAYAALAKKKEKKRGR